MRGVPKLNLGGMPGAAGEAPAAKAAVPPAAGTPHSDDSCTSPSSTTGSCTPTGSATSTPRSNSIRSLTPRSVTSSPSGSFISSSPMKANVRSVDANARRLQAPLAAVAMQRERRASSDGEPMQQEPFMQDYTEASLKHILRLLQVAQGLVKPEPMGGDHAESGESSGVITPPSHAGDGVDASSSPVAPGTLPEDFADIVQSAARMIPVLRSRLRKAGGRGGMPSAGGSGSGPGTHSSASTSVLSSSRGAVGTGPYVTKSTSASNVSSGSSRRGSGAFLSPAQSPLPASAVTLMLSPRYGASAHNPRSRALAAHLAAAPDDDSSAGAGTMSTGGSSSGRGGLVGDTGTLDSAAAAALPSEEPSMGAPWQVDLEAVLYSLERATLHMRLGTTTDCGDPAASDGQRVDTPKLGANVTPTERHMMNKLWLVNLLPPLPRIGYLSKIWESLKYCTSVTVLQFWFRLLVRLSKTSIEQLQISIEGRKYHEKDVVASRADQYEGLDILEQLLGVVSDAAEVPDQARGRTDPHEITLRCVQYGLLKQQCYDRMLRMCPDALRTACELDLSFCQQLPAAPDFLCLLHSQLSDINLFRAEGVNDVHVKQVASACPNAHTINLWGCHQVTDIGVGLVAQHCPKLVSLVLKGCTSIGDAGLVRIADELTSLRDLDLEGCDGITDAGIQRVASACPTLRIVDLRGCHRITDASVRSLARGCTALRSLDLSGCWRITDAGLGELAQGLGTVLTSLYVEGCHQLGDAGLQQLARGCSQLRSLVVAHCPRLGSDGVAALGSLTALLHLVASGCRRVSDAGLQGLAQGCTRLQSLVLNGCSLVSDTGVAFVAQGCPRLQHLDVSRCRRFTDAGVTALSQHCTGLVSLSAQGCHALTDVSLQLLGTSTPELRSLGLLQATAVTDAGVFALAQGCTRLRSLALDGSEAVTDEAVKAVATFCPDLRLLSASGCPLLTDAAIRYLSQGCVLLETLHVRGCDRIGNVSMERLVGNMPFLLDLDVTNTAVDDSGMWMLAEGCAHLVTLTPNARATTDAGLCAVAAGCQFLRRVHLDGCHRVSDAGVAQLTLLCSGLLQLSLRRCPQITDRSFQHFCSSAWDGVRHVDLTATSVTDQGVSLLAAACPSLEELHLGVTRIADLGLRALGISCPHLRKLFVAQCPRLSDEGIIALLDGCLDLETLDVRATCITDATLLHLVHLSAWDGGGGDVASVSPRRRHRRGRGLQLLNVSQCKAITNVGVSAVLRCMAPHLDTLLARGCTQLTGAAFAQSLGDTGANNDDAAVPTDQDGSAVVPTTHRALRRLDVWDCNGIDEAAWLSLLPSCSHLQVLSASGPGVSDVMVGALVAAASCIGQVRLGKGNIITDTAIHSLAQADLLSVLLLSHCGEGVTSAGVGALHQAAGLGVLRVHHCEAVSQDSPEVQQMMASSTLSVSFVGANGGVEEVEDAGYSNGSDGSGSGSGDGMVGGKGGGDEDTVAA